MSTGLPSAADYARRRDWMREWALDLDRLTVLQHQLATTQAELQQTRCENSALKSAVNILRADGEMYKETIVRQHAELQKRQNSVDSETHQGLLDSYFNAQTELDRTKVQLERQTAAFTELQKQRDDERSAHTDRLRAEILSILEPKKMQSVEQAAAAAAIAPEQPQTGSISAPSCKAVQRSETVIASTSRLPASTIPQTSTGSSSGTGTNVVKPRSETVASTSRLPVAAAPDTSSTSSNTTRSQPETVAIVKPELKDEDEDEDDVIVVSEYRTWKHVTPLPEGRRKELATFPEFVPDADEFAVFTRGFLSATLGGNPQALIVKIAPQKQKSLAKLCDVKKFLCPNLSQNPWCPRSPGKHGYMFVGLGTERETFREPEQLNLFLSVPPDSGKALEVRYMGIYEVSRCPELTVDEWRTLPPDVQRNYSATTANRECDSKKENQVKPVARIQAEYDSGVRAAPCVRLRCIGFDEDLYAGLLAANGGTLNNKRKSDSHGESPNPKRWRKEEM